MAKIGQDEVRKANDILQKYRQGKQNLDERIRENERWFRLQHWAGQRTGEFAKRRQTGWLFAAIINKHADFMDNKPECNVLAREQSDEETAQALTEILPVILKRGGWEKSYSACCFDKLKYGGGIYGALWDPDMANGLGDVRITTVNALNMFWEPGIEDLQESRNLFYLELVDHEALKEQYPKIKELQEKLSGPQQTVTTFDYDENIDTTDKSYVVHWYYKKHEKGRTTLHYCKFVQDIVLFASENEEGYENGWYADGQYPFVIDTMFPEPGTPHGFGIIDAMRDTQEDIDQLNDLMMRNAKTGVLRRYFVRDDANINEAEFADVTRELVHFSGSLTEQSIKEMYDQPLSGNYINILESKVQEIKENSFNRDVNTGGAGQTNTAAGIAALQEAGSKSSRSAIQASYRAFEQLVIMVIERLRQFYTVPRIFRIVGDDKSVRYKAFSNEGLTGRPIGDGFGMVFGDKEPVFDLDVRVSKANAWSRQAQNQEVMQFFGMGFFNPEMSTQALACLEVLDIDNKDKLIETIKKNGLKEQFLQQFIPILLQAAQMVDPNLAASAAQAAMAAGIMQPQPVGGQAQQTEKTPEQRGMQQSENYMDKQRQIAASRTAPQA